MAGTASVSGKGGSVIDFVMDLFDLSFRQAVLRLNLDFRLGLTDSRPTRTEVSANPCGNAPESRKSRVALPGGV